MSTYKNIIGKDVNFLSTDPDNDAAEGQIWYNSTSNVFKNLLVNEAWSSGGSMITGRRYFAGAGTQTAGLGFGGNHTGSDSDNNTEEYNGSGWTTGGNLTTARAYLAGCGTQTAGLAFGGATHPSPPVQAVTEEYNGSSWSEQNDLSTARRALAGAGTQTSAVAFSGKVGGTLQTATEEYGGTSWTSGGAMSTARKYLAGAGASQTAALAFGGGAPSATNATEEYDGSSWTTGGILNTARAYLAGCGTQTAALAMAGYNDKTNTEAYDGTSWTNKPAMATGREGVAGGGTTSAGLVFGGKVSDVVSNTEEFNRSTTVTTGAAWAAGGNMNTGRYLLAGCGASESALLGAGGYGPPAPANNTFKIVEEYNGTSWSEVNDLPAIKSRFRAAGTQTAAVTFGGFTPLGPNTNYNTTEKYDGTNWTTSGNMNTARCYMAGFGTQTAAVSAGGATLNPDVGFNKTEEYNGTAWSEVNNMPNFFRNQAGVGIITAGLTSGGKEGPSSSYPGIVNTTTSLEYDGTNWTAGGTSLLPNGNISGGGTQSVAWFAGYPGGNNNNVHYNGTSFVSSVATSITHSAAASGAPQTSGVIFGGYDGGSPGLVASTEEFTPESTAINIKTITTS